VALDRNKGWTQRSLRSTACPDEAQRIGEGHEVIMEISTSGIPADCTVLK
jgi:hypothetical protein